MIIEVYLYSTDLELFKNFSEVIVQPNPSKELFKFQVDLTQVSVTAKRDGLLAIKRYSPSDKAAAEAALQTQNEPVQH